MHDGVSALSLLARVTCVYGWHCFAGMVLMVLGYVLRSPTFGWTGAAGCVVDGSVLFLMVLCAWRIYMVCG
jgi:uncharacterized membrane-anchored protein